MNYETKIEPNAMFKLSYGLYLLTAKNGDFDNGCIINTVLQVTDSPKRIAIAINKKNYTHDIIAQTGEFNVSVLTTEAPFSLFENFGFKSGRDGDKFAESTAAAETLRTENGIRYLGIYANAVISGKVISAADCGTHILFTAEVTEARVLSNETSMTYQYYFDHVKPRPQPAAANKKKWVCRICGYVYEGEELPADYVCPVCKHGADDFELIK